MATYRTSEGDQVDLICYAYYGRTDGTVEAVLEANPGIRDLGPVFPAGIDIELPEVANNEVQQVSLWD
ncbi:tail protein X [Kordiimonas marina]|uniref:tail protein X n=1 Tax=Kordiimonas marina TaxID=2872312 RepID=UPI001FF44CAA|nr:tail protein X [Kordiimonas marina]MCJ9428535.1 tail protein X [Kordiimonas marina]